MEYLAISGYSSRPIIEVIWVMDIEIILGALIPFIGTTLGASMVFLMKDKLNEQFTIIAAMFEKITKKNLKKSDAVEEEIDILRDELIDGHIKRLEEGKCSPASNSIFISLVSNLERAGDHLNYVAHTLYEVK